MNKSKANRSDITYDYLFKGIFGSEKNKRYTVKLIELVIGIKVEKIEVMQDVALNQERRKEKIGRLDVKAIINDGIIVNIEMQNRDEGNIQERTERYGAKIYIDSIDKGMKYEEIKEVILINILNYTINEYEEYMSKTVSVIDKHREKEVKTKIKYYYIELPKVKGKQINDKDELMEWVIYMYGKEKEVIEMIKEKNKDIREMDEEVKRIKKRQEELRMEELRFKWDYDYNYGIAKAEKQGIEKGMAKGIKTGIKTGIKKGILKTAKNMLKQNLSKELIMEVTGLSKEELENA